MSTYRKAYRFRLRPTSAQDTLLTQGAGARRWVWNWALRRWKDHYTNHGVSIPLRQLSSELTALKHQPETAWLKDSDSQALQQTLADLHRAFTNFFEKRARYPKFKSKKRDPLRFRIPQRVTLANGTVSVPKVGRIRLRQSRPVEEPTKSATFRRAPDGHWYVTLTTRFEMPDVVLPAPDPKNVIGIDLGLKNFAVLSSGERIAAPKFFRKAQRILRRAQRAFSRRKPGSRSKASAKAHVARVHQHIADQRRDFLHKLTTTLVTTHDALCIEDLSLRGLARTKLAKSFADTSMGEFRRQLTYKSLWNMKPLMVIDRFFPSSRFCRDCGAVNQALKLSDRQWICGCGTVHDRDLHAAINTRDEGLRLLAAGHAERLNAQGHDVRLPTGSNRG